MRVTCLRLMAGCLVLAGFAVAVPAADEKPPAGFTALFNGKDFTGLKFVLAGKDADPAKTWSVKEGVIVCTGKPNGYFHTEKSYKNYVLRFDWKYTTGGNSGTLIHITGDHKVWPKCIEVQGQFNDHGRIFAIGGAKGEFTVDKEAQKKTIKAPPEWNTTEITCKDGEIVSKVNGVEVSKGKGELTEGTIGFQSEGAEIHFKNLFIKEMK